MPVTRGRALLICAFDGTTIVMATDCPWIAFEIGAEGNYPGDFGLGEAPATGFWLWSGEVRTGTDSGSMEKNEYIGSMLLVGYTELPALLAMTPPT